MRTTRTIISQNRVTLPKQICEAYGLDEGDLVEVDVRPVEVAPRRE